ncbi:hypothetical protein KA005_83350, partial [bacterium]|nr:hypothetical protein [bacterium]
DIASLQTECRNIETAIEEATADEGRGQLRKDRQELLDNISRKETEEKHGVYDVENQIESINRESARLQAEKAELEKKAEITRDLISTAEGYSDSLRKKWHEVDNQQVSGKNKCPSCQQELPGSQVQRAIDAANVEKAEHLERINEDGRKSKSQIETSRGGLENLASQNNDLEERIMDCTAKIDRLKMELSNKPDSDIDEMRKQVGSLTEKIEQSSNQIDVSGLRTDLQAKQSDIATIESQARIKGAIETRRAELKNLSAEFEDLEKNTVLLEKFTETKVEMLTGKINNTFKLARFKLFERQINGGIAETCQTLFNGIPFHTGLNNGAKIQVGLDIIKTFQEHFKVNAPIFIDNAESVVSLPEMDSQLIRLIVDGSFKTLDIKLLN